MAKGARRESKGRARYNRVPGSSVDAAGRTQCARRHCARWEHNGGAVRQAEGCGLTVAAGDERQHRRPRLAILAQRVAALLRRRARIIESDSGAEVYFGEALTYERGAAVALWRVRAQSFAWLPALYDWWADQERIEPVRFTFYLYIPPELKYPALDLREHSPAGRRSVHQDGGPEELRHRAETPKNGTASAYRGGGRFVPGSSGRSVSRDSHGSLVDDLD